MRRKDNGRFSAASCSLGPGGVQWQWQACSFTVTGWRRAHRAVGMGWTRKEVGIVFCLSLILLLAVWLAAEVSLAILRPAPIQRDDLLGWRLKPNFHRVFMQKTLGGKDYPVAFSTNDQGLRVFGSAAAPVKILVLGDSFTADPYAANDRMWYVAMAQRLAVRLGRPASDFYVMGGGAGGWGTYQTLLLSQQQAARIKPNIFVLQFCSNDFQNHSYEWERKGVVRGQFLRRPFIDAKSGQPKYAPGLMAEIYRSVAGESRLFNRIDGVIGNMQFQRYGGYTQPLSPQAAAMYERDSIALTQSLLTRLRRIYRNIPAVMVNCDGAETGANKSWKVLARSAGFVPLDAASDFLHALAPERRAAVFHADGSHLSDEGNQLYGALVGDGIASLRLALPARH